MPLKVINQFVRQSIEALHFSLYSIDIGRQPFDFHFHRQNNRLPTGSIRGALDGGTHVDFKGDKRRKVSKQ